MVSRRALAAAVIAVNTASIEVAWSEQRLALDLGLGAEYATNPARVSEDEESDVASVASARIALQDKDGALETDMGYQLQHRDYVDDVEDDETAVDGKAALKWHALPRHLDVILQHQVSQTQTNLRTTDTPSNRERRSILTGGFDGFIRFTPVDDIVISPRYTDVKFSESDQSDSQRSQVDVSWVHALDGVSRFSFGGGVGKSAFDENGRDYDFTSVLVGYQAALARLNYSISGGISKFDRDEGDNVDGHILRADINYATDTFDVGANVASELTDTSFGLAGNTFQLEGFTPSDTNFDQVDILQRSQVDLYWRQRIDASTSLNVGFGAVKDDYETTTQDEEVIYASVDGNRVLNSYWTIGTGARFERVEFTDDPLGSDYDETTLQINGRYQATQRLDFRLTIMRVDRSADSSAAEYTDNVVAMTVNYRVL